MTEDFIHFLWKYRLFEPVLHLTTGESCTVLNPGLHNQNAGPDFLHAKVRIGRTTWAGNVEIHVNSGEWIKHGHTADPAYDNVILHVVVEDDEPVVRQNGEPVPTVVVNGRFDPGLIERFNRLMETLGWIPCESMLSSAGRVTVNAWLDRVMVERLERRLDEIKTRLDFNRDDWNETFYQSLASNFGFKVNALPFELLAKSLPLKILAKHRDNLFQVEALMMGQAGLLKKPHRDTYFSELKQEYNFLQKKYGLIPLDTHLWRFMRMRPSNFPTVRLSQFASLLSRSPHIFSSVLEAGSVSEIGKLFETSASDYWTSHYMFDKRSAPTTKTLGKTGTHLILINTVIPFLFSFGKLRGDDRLTDRALRFLELIPGESNAVITRWSVAGLNTHTAFQTQALLELHRSYCSQKRCFHCGIGVKLISGSP